MLLHTLEIKRAYTLKGVPVSVKAVANVKIRSDDTSLQAAAERFLGMTPDQMQRVIFQTLEGHLRAMLDKMLALQKYFEPYGIDDFVKGGGGVDIGPLAKLGTPLSSFIPEMQRYFDVHHSVYDTFEQVHLREFQLGSAAMASFIYLIDKRDL